MKQKLLISLTLIFSLSSCFDGGDSSNSTPASQKEVVAQAPASVASSGLPGKTITFNPTLVFDSIGETINYSNDSSDSVYPSGNFIDVDLNETVEGDRLVISITVDGQKIDLGFSFVDRGGEGFIDEAVLDVVKVDNVEQTLPEKVTVTIDAGTVVNEGIAEEDRLDISGAPSEEEWNRYVVGTAILLENLAYQDFTLVRFNSATSGQYVDLEDGYTGDFTYSYTQDGNTTGNLSVSSEWLNEDDTDYPDSIGHKMRDEFVLEVSFKDFYNGTWKDGEGKVIDLETNQEYDWDDDYGEFNGITNVDLYIEQASQN
jgi:hypothetical protein